MHSKELEIVWTSIPALLLLVLSTPSFTLLYAMDEVLEPELTLKILGHQWFWSYGISEFNSCQKQEQSLKYVCYMIAGLCIWSIFVVLQLKYRYIKKQNKDLADLNSLNKSNNILALFF